MFKAAGWVQVGNGCVGNLKRSRLRRKGQCFTGNSVNEAAFPGILILLGVVYGWNSS